MIYVFEGSRNSGKTYLSNSISDRLGIPRFQFNFSDFFNLLNLKSRDNREAHSFAMGKELMLMQLSKDLDVPNFIHDRGILTVLSWGLSENRITKEDVESQIDFIKKSGLLSNITIIYINGKNPDSSDRNKDQWDYADKTNVETEAFEFVVSRFRERGINCISTFNNNFDESIILEIESFIKDNL